MCFRRKYQERLKTARHIHSINRPFPSSPGPLFQNDGRCAAFDMEINSYSHANKTHFHKKGCAPSLILKVRVFGTRKWPIDTSSRLEIHIAFQIPKSMSESSVGGCCVAIVSLFLL